MGNKKDTKSTKHSGNSYKSPKKKNGEIEQNDPHDIITGSSRKGQKDEKNEDTQRKESNSDNKESGKERGTLFHELKEKPLTVSIPVITVLCGILLSLFKLVSYYYEKQLLECFHISRKLLAYDLSETSLILLISFILSILALIIFFSVFLSVRRKGFIIKSIEPLQVFIWEICGFYYVLFISMYLKLSDDLYGIVLSSAFLFVFFIMIIARLLVSSLIKLRNIARKRQSKTNNEQAKQTQPRETEKQTSPIEIVTFSIEILLLVLFSILANRLSNKDSGYFLRQLENNAIVSEEKLYAIIYKTDDYIIGEAIEEKVDQNGETYYEIDTTRQQLFDSFDFEMKYLGDDASFALKPLNVPAQNPAATNKTAPATTVPYTTVPNTTTTDTTTNP